VDLYIHSPIRLHGVVLNSLSIGTTLPLPFTIIFSLCPQAIGQFLLDNIKIDLKRKRVGGCGLEPAG
jgi:hypothetical protein